MSNLKESSSSSDDDDMLEALKEATDSQFLNESLFQHKNETEKKNTKADKSELPKSLRRTFEFVEEPNEFGVTQDFKNFVAKQLAKSLDRYVEEIIDDKNDFHESKFKNKQTVHTLDGIKLMTDSKVNLVDIERNHEENTKHNARQRKKLRTLDTSAEQVSKFKQVAVDPEWVLSRASTAVWTHRQKGTLYKYKKSNNGALVEIN